MKLKHLTREELIARIKADELGAGDDPCIIRKAGISEVETVDGSDRTLRFTISTAAVDRDNDVVNQSGWKLEAYRKNPVVLWAHDYSALPLAKSIDIGLEGGHLKATAEFDTHPFAETVLRMLKGGFLNATSVGFAPINAKVNKERDGVDFEQQELLEFSVVPVPANPEALIEARAAGIDTTPIKEWAEAVTKAFASKPPDWKSAITDGRGVRHAKVWEPGTKTYFYRPEEEVPADDPVRWNRSLSKGFDVDGEPVEPALLEYKWASRFLDVPVKDLYETTLHIPGARMGAMLSALDEGYGRFECRSVRNITTRGEEAPPTYETVQLNSKLQRSFLTNGTRFLVGDYKMVARTQESWSGVCVTLFVARPAAEKAVEFLAEARQRSRQYKFLKGEAFSLSGEFLDRGDTNWDQLFLDAKVMEPIRRSAQLLNEKGAEMESRGQILMGPPGTGKTLAARALMGDAKDATFIWVSSRDFYRAGAFGGIEMAYDLAAENAPAVVLFEDIDSWWDSYSIDLLKTELDGLKQRKGIVTLLTTNFPETLPEALIDRPGRFHDVIELGLPGEAVRRQMLGAWAGDAAAEALDALAKETDGLSGAHLRELVRFATTIREQDGLGLEHALARALEKVREQREMIDALQTGRRVRRAVKAIEARHAAPLISRKGGTGCCDRCAAEGDLSVGVCEKCREELHGWSRQAEIERTAGIEPAQKALTVADIGLIAEAVAKLLKGNPMPEHNPTAGDPDDEDEDEKERRRREQDGGGDKPEKAFVIELDDAPETVLDLLDDDDTVIDITPEELKAALRGAIASGIGEIVRHETQAALNRARGRVD